MATTLTSTINWIKAALDRHFEQKGYEWKTVESQTEHRQDKPTVFALVCAERNGANFPVICPSITIELADVTANGDNLDLNLVFHCVTVGAAITDREQTVKSGDAYTFLDSDGFTDTGAVEALFADCLKLAEETMNALRALSGLSNIKLYPPDTLDDFPYCQCQVTATSRALARFVPDDFL